MGRTRHRRAGRPRNDALRAQRRESILNAAAAMFARRGFAKTDLQTVADGLGVAKGTLYRYFRSKQALFLAAVDWGMHLLLGRMERATEERPDPLDRIAAGVHAYLSFFDQRPEFAELLIQERAQFKDRRTPTYFEHRQEGIRPWKLLTRRLIEAGRVRLMPVDAMTDVMSNLLYGTMFTNFFAGRQKSTRRQAREILDVVFHGVLTDTKRNDPYRVQQR
jgi:AcrR family transcriptional regulator